MSKETKEERMARRARIRAERRAQERTQELTQEFAQQAVADPAADTAPDAAGGTVRLEPCQITRGLAALSRQSTKTERLMAVIRAAAQTQELARFGL